MSSPSTSSRATPRSATPTSPAAAAATGSNAQSHARSRSFRSGPPVSARAAAGQRRDSHLASTSGSNTTAGVENDDAARAETIAALDDLKERLAKAETASEDYRKQAEVLRAKLDETTSEQVKFEEKCHEHEEQIETLQNAQREANRKIREMEAIYEAERSSMVKEKEETSNREEQLQMVIARLKDTLNQKMSKDDDDVEVRSTRPLNPTSPSVEGGSFAQPASLQRSDSRSQSKLVMQKDKLIESLRLELAEAQIKLVESENRGGGRLQEVEKLLMETRMANARLMEDNESYQLLLQEKTLNGDFKDSDFSYMGGPQSNDDALAALEGKSGSSSLADELGDAADGEEKNDRIRQLETDLRSMKDQNKALTLYINRIIERLLQHQDYEHILDQSSPGAKADTNKELPLAPIAPRDVLGLPRAKSMMVSPTTKSRPRPMSVMPTAANLAQFANPDAALNLPIGVGRTQSTRRVRPLSDQMAGVASVVNQMYKGPDGPLSPISRNSQPFFSTPQRERNTSGATAGSVHGNFPGMISETSSVSGDSSQMTADRDTISSISNQSPPREKKMTQKFDAGKKPRPLRLVEEKNEAQAAVSKRQSWIGQWFAKKEDLVSPRESVIKE